MKIEEAIEHCYDVAVSNGDECEECKREHIQLAGWLKELVAIREFFKANSMEICFRSDGSVKGVSLIEASGGEGY